MSLLDGLEHNKNGGGESHRASRGASDRLDPCGLGVNARAAPLWRHLARPRVGLVQPGPTGGIWPSNGGRCGFSREAAAGRHAESIMAGSVNKVILVGNLGADPEVRRTQDGRPIVNLRVATSETWRDKTSGERREKTEWHRVVIFSEGLAK